MVRLWGSVRVRVSVTVTFNLLQPQKQFLGFRVAGKVLELHERSVTSEVRPSPIIFRNHP